MILGSDANALSANFPGSCEKTFSLFFIHSLAPPFLSVVVVLSDVGIKAVTSCSTHKIDQQETDG